MLIWGTEPVEVGSIEELGRRLGERLGLEPVEKEISPEDLILKPEELPPGFRLMKDEELPEDAKEDGFTTNPGFISKSFLAEMSESFRADKVRWIYGVGYCKGKPEQFVIIAGIKYESDGMLREDFEKIREEIKDGKFEPSIMLKGKDLLVIIGRNISVHSDAMSIARKLGERLGFSIVHISGS